MRRIFLYLRSIYLPLLLLVACPHTLPQPNIALVPTGWFEMGEHDSRHSNEPRRPACCAVSIEE